jgi:hypothetical protein
VVPRVFSSQSYNALRLIFLLSLAIFPPEPPKMLANTKVLPALFNVPDEKLSQREKQWLFFRRKLQTKSYLNDNGTAEIY